MFHARAAGSTPAESFYHICIRAERALSGVAKIAGNVMEELPLCAERLSESASDYAVGAEMHPRWVSLTSLLFCVVDGGGQRGGRHLPIPFRTSRNRVGG